MTGPLSLFDMDPAPVSAPPEKLSPQRRRTIRQLALLEAGRHPLTAVAGRPLLLHPDAPPATGRQAPGPRCGTCLFRDHWGAHSFPKCLRGESQPFATHAAATDCRAWWPACSHWEPKP